VSLLLIGCNFLIFLFGKAVMYTYVILIGPMHSEPKLVCMPAADRYLGVDVRNYA
jgi:hypothetical protein